MKCNNFNTATFRNHSWKALVSICLGDGGRQSLTATALSVFVDTCMLLLFIIYQE